MPHTHDLLRSRLHAQAGIHPPAPLYSTADFTALARTQWSSAFELYMRNRLKMGLFRYGRLGARNKPTFDMVPSIIRRAKAYLLTGNDEHLVDIANLAMVEFVEGKHPKKHFAAQDDGIHCTPQ